MFIPDLPRDEYLRERLQDIENMIKQVQQRISRKKENTDFWHACDLACEDTLRLGTNHEFVISSPWWDKRLLKRPKALVVQQEEELEPL